jgi:hypothetical protein
MLQNFCMTNEEIIRNKLFQFTTVKNSCIEEVNDHYDQLIDFLITKREEAVNDLEMYSKDKITM